MNGSRLDSDIGGLFLVGSVDCRPAIDRKIDRHMQNSDPGSGMYPYKD